MYLSSFGETRSGTDTDSLGAFQTVDKRRFADVRNTNNSDSNRLLHVSTAAIILQQRNQSFSTESLAALEQIFRRVLCVD